MRALQTPEGTCDAPLSCNRVVSATRVHDEAPPRSSPIEARLSTPARYGRPVPEPLAQLDALGQLPRKRIGAGVLFLNDAGDVLLVNPTYKDYWEVPGGLVESGESPRTAAKREIREELGVDIVVGRLLLIDWNPAGYLPDDGVIFLYLGGRLDDRQIRLPSDELSEWCWCPSSALRERLLDFKARRVGAAIDAYERDVFAELEDGRPVN